MNSIEKKKPNETWRTKIVHRSLEYLKSKKLNDLQQETISFISKRNPDNLTPEQFNSLHHIVEEIKIKRGDK